MADRSDYHEFVLARSERLLRLAYLLTHDWMKAEDLLQAALIKVWSAWRNIEGKDPEAYVRRVIVTTHVSWWRRRRVLEQPIGGLTDRPLPHDAIAEADQRDAMWRALGRLPARQRAVVVLRYFEDLTEVQVAELLNCSVGTVKSQHARALAKLRADSSIAPTLAWS
jgi:RNA polymerase sigma-70 factor (sigma-E family)